MQTTKRLCGFPRNGSFMSFTNFGVVKVGGTPPRNVKTVQRHHVGILGEDTENVGTKKGM